MAAAASRTASVRTKRVLGRAVAPNTVEAHLLWPVEEFAAFSIYKLVAAMRRVYMGQRFWRPRVGGPLSPAPPAFAGVSWLVTTTRRSWLPALVTQFFRPFFQKIPFMRAK